MLPRKISISDSDDLVIEWSDNETSSINKYLLRKSCPCAVCKVERDKNHHDYNLFRGDKTEITDIEIVGQHALKISRINSILSRFLRLGRL